MVSPDDYVRSKHTKDFDKFTKELLPNGQIIYKYDNGSILYSYEFTELWLSLYKENSMLILFKQAEKDYDICTEPITLDSRPNAPCVG